MKGYLTQSDIVNLKLNVANKQIISKRLSHLINSHKKTKQHKQFIDAYNYYNDQHDIKNFVRYYYDDSGKRVDHVSPNNKLIHNFFEILIEQKKHYVVGNPIKVSYKADDDLVDDGVTKLISLVLKDKFDTTMMRLVELASLGGVAYLHVYLNGAGDLCLLPFSVAEIIPVYDTEYQDELLEVIRYYKVDEIDEGNNYETTERYRVEWWDKDFVYYYKQIGDNTFVLDESITPNPRGHFVSLQRADNDVYNVEQMSWGVVPFIPFYNNDRAKSDLTEGLKTLIDAYNKVKSGWLNDIEELQELIFVLKGYLGLGGTKNQSKLSVFLQNLKQNKVIAVDENGGVDTIRNDIPIEAKREFLRLTREEIFYLGKGIDVTQDKFGSAPSGVSLKFLYSQLDLKANGLISSLKSGLEKLNYFIVKHLYNTDKVVIEPMNIFYTFNKSVIYNESEKIQALKMSEGMISKDTIIDNHPLVTEPAIEKQRLKQEQETDINYGLKLIKEQQ